ncbi:MAG TPA: hypothetical protein IAC82_13330 [Candidatus Merdivicinus intestinigallinarum]|nr:hypothetical protein [Candidatus Merdivicinus intestinigallinarum]
MAKEKRFVTVWEESTMLRGSRIMVDTQTGVHYLVTEAANGGGGITPLLGPDGKPVITLEDVEEQNKGIYGN